MQLSIHTPSGGRCVVVDCSARGGLLLDLQEVALVYHVSDLRNEREHAVPLQVGGCLLLTSVSSGSRIGLGGECLFLLSRGFFF